MVRYWAKDLYRSWNKRIIALFTVLSILLSNFASIAETSDPAVDLSALICGITQHEHTDACYADVLICGKKETDPQRIFLNTFDIHQHTADCYDGNGSLICGKKETEYFHTHNEYCLDAYGSPVCGLEVRIPHYHTEACYDADGNLICGQEEKAGIPTFICTADNWTEEGGHHHDEGCYEKQLICGLQEHVHGPECYGTIEITDEPGDELETVPETKTDTEATTEEASTTDKTLAAEEAEETWEGTPAEEETSEDASDPAGEETTSVTPEVPDGRQEQTETIEPAIADSETETPVEAEPEAETPITETSEIDITTTDTSDATDTTTQHSESSDPESQTAEEIPAFEISGKKLIRYNGNEETVTVPKGIRRIDKKAFYGNKTIIRVILPDSVRLINSSAFADCPNLEQVIISENSKLQTIGLAAFRNDRKLDTSFAANVKHVADNAFEGIGEEKPAEPVKEPINEESGEDEETTDEETTDEETTNEESEADEEPIDEEPETDEEQPDSKPADEAEEPTEQAEQTDSVDPEEGREADELIEAEPAAESEQEAEKEEEPEDPETSETPEETEEAEESEKTETTETADENTVETIEAKDAPFSVSVSFSPNAGIPEGTELVVTEPGASRTASPEKVLKTRKALMSASPAKTTEEPHANIPSLTTWSEGEAEPDIILYQKTLDISLVADGKEIEPNPDTNVTVTITLPDIEAGQKVEVRHITDEGTKLLESTNDAGTITFMTDSFSLFEFTSSAQKITSKTSEWLDYTLFGRSTDQTATLENTKIDENSLPDGFTIIDTTSTTQNSNLWITLQRVKDIVLGKLESISLYAVENGRITALVKENVGITDVLRLNLGNYSSFALVRDSGLRSRIEELGNVVLTGLMPKNGTAEATDVTEEYENFVVGRSVSKEGEADKELGGEGSDKEGEAFEELGGEGSGKQEETVRTIAAYDISIKNDGEEYQPEDKPITVTIQADQIATAVANGNAISLWHVLDDGTAEQVENFTITGDTVVFDATGFSVYVVTETTIEKILTAADGKVYKITVTYDGSAQIPEGAELVVTEMDEDQYLTSAATALGVEEDYLLYRKFLDISFVDTDGEIIEPAAPVSVKIELLDVEAGADKLQVVHFGEDGAEKVDSEANSNAVVTFTSGDFSVFGFGNVLEPLATTETEEARIELLGFGAEKELTATDAPEFEEGLEVLGAYSLGETGKVWIKAELKDDVELSSMESVTIYTVNNEDEEVAELAGMDTITELPTTEFAVIKDSGYRHLSFELNTDEEKTVSLDGMMPKAAEATALDVTDLYTDHEFTDSAPIDNEETAPVDDEETGEGEQEEAEGDQQEDAEGPSHTTNRVTLAAYDISITNNDTDYQPDEVHPVSVVISDSRILQSNNIEIWHIRDDGTEERVEDFTVENGTLSFSATGFSTYAIVYNITTYYQTSTGETYKITVEYGDDAGLPEGVKLRVTEVEAGKYLSDIATALGTTDSYLLYKMFFDISFVRTDEDGEHIIEPNAPVNVTIELLDVTDGADKLQVVHFGADGAEKIDSQATEEAVVSFVSKDFSVYGVGNVLTPLATAETDEASIEILGFGGETEIISADAPAVEEGLEVLGAYNLPNETERVWIKADVKDGVELSSMESVVIYGIKEDAVETPTEDDESSTGEAGDEQTSEVPDEKPTEDQAAEQNEEQSSIKSATVENGLVSELVEAGTVAELTVSNFALVKDSGYRHLNFEINVGESYASAEDAEKENTEDDGEESTAQLIILDGMMPKMATAEAVDVTEAYADHEYVVPEEEQEEAETEQEESLDAAEDQPVSNDAGEDTEEPATENTQEDTDEAQDGAEEPQEGEAIEQKRITLAAFNITISNNDSEYQPDIEHPIRVEIVDSRITVAENIELWHIKGDGSEERVEEFTVEDGKVEFVATGFSVYTIVFNNDTSSYVPAGWVEISSVNQISEYGEEGFRLKVRHKTRTGEGEHFIRYNLIENVKGHNGRTGLDAITLVANDENKYVAPKFYFETSSIIDASTITCYIYKLENEEKKYLEMFKFDPNNTGRGALRYAENKDSSSLFTVKKSGTGEFYIFTKVQGMSNNVFWNRQSLYDGTNLAKNPGGIIGWNNDNEDTAYLTLYYTGGEAERDHFKLDGNTYSIAYYEESVKASGLMSGSNSSNGLEAAPLLVKPSILNQTGEMLIAEDNDLSTWTFHCVEENSYRISTQIAGETRYLCIGASELELVSEEHIDDAGTIITVDNDPDNHPGKYRLSVKVNDVTYALTLKNGSTDSGFASLQPKGNNEQYAWLNLTKPDEILIDEDFQIYTAKKVSIAHHKNDPSLDAVQNGDQVVIYARVWNDTTLKYEHYAINHEGQMFRVYESGDTIQWVGSQVNSALWDFTAYYWTDGNGDYDYLKDDEGNNILDSNGNPIKVENLYYELQNVYSGQYLAPLYGDHLFQDGTLGIHLDGRSGGYDYSTITAWDDDANMYVDLIGGDVKTDDKEHLGTRKKNVLKPYYFYFAKMTDTNVVTKLSTVDTVNNSIYGITMKMIDFNNGSGSRDSFQSQFFNGDDNGPGALSVKLDGDYPVAKHGNTSSLSGLYSGAADVNHLFIQSTYNNSGYFVYDSTQNYAYLPGGAGDFTVYDQLGTIKGRTSAFSSYHGQFFPYNDLYQKDAQGNYILDGSGNKIPWAYDETIFNTKDILGNELPDSDPRKGEGLHAIPQDQIDYFYAMEMEAGFTQTVSGEDAWGHDIIFEFSGDDDFWLYVDGDLVLDLGGVHSAMSGSVNFKTGQVKVSTNHKPRVPVWNSSTGQVEYKYSGTLRQIFEANYRMTNPGCTFDEVEAYLDERFDGNIFKDYSTHEMRMFYMERGAGGSNLKMRFNLASVKPGHVILSKELDGVDYPVSSIGDFFFQIKYEIPDNEGNAVTGIFDGTNNDSMNVLKYESIEPVTHIKGPITIGGVTYEHVYKLKAGEKADINMPDSTIKYWITECGVDTTIFDHVYVNDEEVTASASSEDRADFSTDRQSFNQRKQVNFVNHVDPNALGTLHITKNLYDETGAVLTDDTTPFTFRLYMGTENESLSGLSTANQIRYYVKYGENYCKWDLTTKEYVVTEKTASDLHRNDDDPDDINSWDYYVVHTSKYGSIARIPAGYTVEVREILKNTKFKVEERNYEIPEGYSLRDYLLNGTITETTSDNPSALPQGSIVGGQTTTVTVENNKGYGFIMNKIWTDEQFMIARDDTYFALYKGDTLVPGTLKRLKFSTYNAAQEESTEEDPFKQLRNKNTSLYWYLERLEHGGEFTDYKVYEVTLDDLSDPSTLTIDSDNNVSGYTGTITRVDHAGEIIIKGQQEGDTAPGEFTYEVSYVRGNPGGIPATLQSLITLPEDGSSTTRNNIRVDAITNTREGITLYKKDMLGNPLEGAKFELVELDTDGTTVVSTRTFTSNSDGLIATAYLKERVNYELREISAPIGYVVDENDDPSSYHASEQAITLYLDPQASDGDVVKVDGDINYIEDTGDQSNPNPVIIIKNKKYTLQIKKTDSASQPLEGVEFALYPQVNRSVGGVIRPGRDYYPVNGFGNLTTNAQGFVTYVDEDDGQTYTLKTAFETGKLKPGTYYLHEKGAYSNNDVEYQPLEGDVIFTVSPTGTVSEYIADDGTRGFPTGTNLTNPVSESDNIINYQINVVNAVAREHTVKIKKIVADGTAADESRNYEFTAKLYLPDKTTPWKYGDHGFSDGEISFTLPNYEDKDLKLPTLKIAVEP